MQPALLILHRDSFHDCSGKCGLLHLPVLNLVLPHNMGERYSSISLFQTDQVIIIMQVSFKRLKLRVPGISIVSLNKNLSNNVNSCKVFICLLLPFYPFKAVSATIFHTFMHEITILFALFYHYHWEIHDEMS